MKMIAYLCIVKVDYQSGVQYSNVTDCAEGVKFDRQTNKMPAANERFGATAAGSADLKGSAEMPPLRQAAIPLAASGRLHSGQ